MKTLVVALGIFLMGNACAENIFISGYLQSSDDDDSNVFGMSMGQFFGKPAFQFGYELFFSNPSGALLNAKTTLNGIGFETGYGIISQGKEGSKEENPVFALGVSYSNIYLRYLTTESDIEYFLLGVRYQF